MLENQFSQTNSFLSKSESGAHRHTCRYVLLFLGRLYKSNAWYLFGVSIVLVTVSGRTSVRHKPKIWHCGRVGDVLGLGHYLSFPGSVSPSKRKDNVIRRCCLLEHRVPSGWQGLGSTKQLHALRTQNSMFCILMAWNKQIFHHKLYISKLIHLAQHHYAFRQFTLIITLWHFTSASVKAVKLLVYFLWVVFFLNKLFRCLAVNSCILHFMYFMYTHFLQHVLILQLSFKLETTEILWLGLQIIGCASFFPSLMEFILD